MLLEKLLPLNRKVHEKEGESDMNVLHFFSSYFLSNLDVHSNVLNISSPNDDSD